jgi:hypothetical protein
VAEVAGSESGHGVVASLGTFVFRLPLFDFVQGFKVRFAGEAVADLAGAVKGAGGRWDLAEPSPEERESLDRSLDDLLGRGGEERTPADVLQAVAAGDPDLLGAILETDRALNDRDQYLARHRRNFRRHLAGFLLEALNPPQEGRHDRDEPRAPARFATALYLAGRLRDLLAAFLASCESRSAGVLAAETAGLAEDLARAYCEEASAAAARLAAYRDCLVGGGGPAMAPAGAAGDAVEGQPALLPYLTAAREQAVGDRRAESDLLVREYFHSEALEARLYEECLGEAVRREHLGRFLWRYREHEEGGELALHLVVAAERRLEPDRTRVEEAAAAVTELAEILLQPLWEKEITPYLAERYPQPAALADRVEERAAPLIQFDRHLAPRHTRKLFTNLRQSDYATAMLKQFRSRFPRREHVQPTSFLDPHSFATVMVADSLPLPALRPYQQALSAYLSLPATRRATLHLFAAEQRAVRLEERLRDAREPERVFHPRLASRLAEPERLELFALAVVYELIPNALSPQERAWHLAPGAGGEPLLLHRLAAGQPPLFGLAEAFVEGKTPAGAPIPFGRVASAIEARRRGAEDLLAYLKGRSREIERLRGRAGLQGLDRDCLSYIGLAVEEEVRGVESRLGTLEPSR